MPNGKGPISKAVQTQLNDLIAENLVPQETTPAYVPPPVLVDCILGHFCTKRRETAAGLTATPNLIIMRTFTNKQLPGGN